MKHQSPNPVHPRLRGELCQHSQKELETSGSSPLTRGTPYAYDIKDLSQRFIPAYAGNSCSNCFDSWTTAVHPRLRGELVMKRSSREGQSGSSPLTRGTHLRPSPLSRYYRFIPAYAGNSLPGFFALSKRSVHPRLRGELARKLQLIENNPRFIPAYAGNSLGDSAHGFNKSGSSPLTRGTPT